MMTKSPISRRDALRLVAVTAAGGTLMTQRAFAQEASAETAALMPGADVCVLTPEVTEGPYYFDPAMERADITEGFAGIPTRIKLQVVDGACKPIKGARVDIWHCNAAGVYSGYANQTGGVDTTGQTFLRGTLFADDTGIVTFSTIYPGWYSGRTTHVHFKVFLDETNVLTGQIAEPVHLREHRALQDARRGPRHAEQDRLDRPTGDPRQLCLCEGTGRGIPGGDDRRRRSGRDIGNGVQRTRRRRSAGRRCGRSAAGWGSHGRRHWRGNGVAGCGGFGAGELGNARPNMIGPSSQQGSRADWGSLVYLS